MRSRMEVSAERVVPPRVAEVPENVVNPVWVWGYQDQDWWSGLYLASQCGVDGTRQSPINLNMFDSSSAAGGSGESHPISVEKGTLKNSPQEQQKQQRGRNITMGEDSALRLDIRIYVQDRYD